MDKRKRERLLQQLAEDDGKDSDQHALTSAAPIDDLAYNRRAATAPPAPPPDPLLAIVRSIRNIRWALVAIAIPVIASGKLVITHLLDRVEASTLAKIEIQRLHEDVDTLKRGAEKQAGAIRDAEEALRTLERRLKDLLGERPPPWRAQ